jgi:hypothetical protein
LPKYQDLTMLEKKNKDLEPEIAMPVVFAYFILAIVVLLIWMAS